MRKVNSSTFKSADGNADNIYTEAISPSTTIYRLVGDLKPNTRFIQSDDVVGFIKGQRTILRYSPNEATQEKSKQKIDFVDKEGIIFEFGELSVNDRQEPNKNSFLRAHYGNTANGGQTFYEYNPLAKAEAKTKRDDAIMDAKLTIREKLKTDSGIQELRQVARGLKLPSHDSVLSALKADLYVMCNQRPSDVLEAFEDKLIKAKAYASICLENGEIVYRNNGVYWKGQQKKLFTIPTGKDVIDEVAFFSVQPLEIEFFGEIEKLALGKKRKK